MFGIVNPAVSNISGVLVRLRLRSGEYFLQQILKFELIIFNVSGVHLPMDQRVQTAK